MDRRAFLTATSGVLAVSGCLSSPPGRPSGTDRPTGESPGADGSSGSQWTPVRRTADGVEATFRILDARAPTDETATASVEDGRVVVTGTVVPHGCRHPVLGAVGYDRASDTVRLVVGTEATDGRTATVVCDAVGYDYRTVASADRGPPSTVDVVHEHDEREDRTFTVEL